MEDLQNELAAMQLELQRMRDHAGQPAASVVIQRERKLRHFSGSGDVSLVDWLEEARACIVVQGLTGRAAANFAISYLEGAARMEMRCQPDEVRSDADQIFLALEEVFGEKSSTSQLLRAFYERRQQISERYLTFPMAWSSWWTACRGHHQELRTTVTGCCASNSLKMCVVSIYDGNLNVEWSASQPAHSWR